MINQVGLKSHGEGLSNLIHSNQNSLPNPSILNSKIATQLCYETFKPHLFIL